MVCARQSRRFRSAQARRRHFDPTSREQHRSTEPQRKRLEPRVPRSQSGGCAARTPNAAALARVVPTIIARMSWRIDKQANGKFAIHSSRIDDYIVIDADELQIAQIYAEKGVKVYLASARMQVARETPVGPEGEAKIEASRKRGSTPKEGEVPIGVTGFSTDDRE
jgi:hypothetical protein